MSKGMQWTIFVLLLQSRSPVHYVPAVRLQNHGLAFKCCVDALIADKLVHKSHARFITIRSASACLNKANVVTHRVCNC